MSSNQGFSEQEINDAIAAFQKHGSKTLAAQALNISVDSLKRRLRRVGGSPVTLVPPVPKPKLVEPGLGPTPQDRKIVALEDEVRRLRNVIRENHRIQNDFDTMLTMLGIAVERPVNPPSWLDIESVKAKSKLDFEVPVTIWSDWHLGEVIEPDEVNGYNAYNLTIAEQRIKTLVESTIQLSSSKHIVGGYDGIVINMLGDFVSGGLHPELAKTDEVEPIEAACICRDWIIASWNKLLEHFPKIYAPWACGNHGRTTAKPEFKKYYRKNVDYLIYRMVAHHFRDDPRVTIDFRPSNDVYYRVYNERYFACHGDMLGVKGGDGIIGAIGPIKRGSFKKSTQAAAFGQPFDKILVGHWHQRLWLPDAIVNNAPKGFDEYAKNQLGAKPDVPTQALWFVHQRYGITAHWDVYLEKPPEHNPVEWVSWSLGMAA